MRIVSLLPSATDIIVSLGAKNELVGVSHSCSPEHSHLPTLTSTRVDTTVSSHEIDLQVKSAAGPLYDLDVELLEALAPDVIVSQSLCDVCAVSSGDVESAVREISSKPTLVNLTPHDLSDIPTGFHDVGEQINRQSQAAALTKGWNLYLADVKDRFLMKSPLKLVFLDWLTPPYASGHWMPELIEHLGCTSLLAKPGEPSFEVTWDDVRNAEPDLIAGACCGLSLERAHQDWIPEDINIHLLDGYENFSRPSPKLLESAQKLIALIDSSLAGPCKT
jgi:iron complex transport system substrate-binding protein